ncbi:MAG: ABC transporter permease [Phycisphaerales bacterium]|nr:ABC transporter permease [Phycisphaerales bacterium]
MNPAKVLRVAAREFASTVITKGFVIGALVVPALMTVIIPVVAGLAMRAQPAADKGTVYVLDRSGEVTPTLTERLSPDEVRGRWESQSEAVKNATKSLVPGAIGDKAADKIDKASEVMPFPHIRVVPTATDANLDDLKAEIREQVASKSSPADEIDTLLAVVEIDADATRKASEDEGFGAYQAFFRPKLNEETVGEIKESVRWAIREQRYENAGVDRGQIRELDSINARQSKEITEEGERKESAEIASYAIPFVSMILLLIASMTGGQYLLTTTIEEKSNRVVEVLLSALSPMELMTGKILGQMGVGLSLLTIYSSVGVMALIFFTLSDLVDVLNIAYIFIFFLFAYCMFASLMAAIGSAVNDLREAQALMTPVMMTMIIPYVFFMPVIRAPNSMLSTVMSFIPPISPFIMIMRVSSTDPPPFWQIGLVILINIGAVLVFLWFAAKVFRVGLLMFGKPPNFRTLIKWIRMA